MADPEMSLYRNPPDCVPRSHATFSSGLATGAAGTSVLVRCMGLLLALALLALSYPPRLAALPAAPAEPGLRAGSAPVSVYLPLVTYQYLSPTQRLCRFGAGARLGEATTLAVNSLRIGWYTDWVVSPSAARPGGITYLPTIRLSQTGLDAYAAAPDGPALAAAVRARRGAMWMIGNEPDRINWQDGVEPHVYARAYHDLYLQIKAADPTALVVAGNIVQPTPLRLQYLDMVLEAYRRLYGQPMPVDVWNTHAFILNERSCSVYPEDCWGAEVPPGVDAAQGLVLSIDDNDNIEIFKTFIRDFRIWLALRGYRERPLIITEFGVLMPADYGFDVPRVNRFMNAAFDFLTSAADPATGYSHDENRLVQRWAWYSIADDHFNGPLFDLRSGARTAFGDNFAAYTARIAPMVNLRPVRLWVESAQMPAAGGPVTLTLAAEMVNNGDMVAGPLRVRFYRGDPAAGGIPIGADQWLVALDGCATAGVVRAVWPAAPPGQAEVWVVADPLHELTERHEDDNALSARLLVPATRIALPYLFK